MGIDFGTKKVGIALTDEAGQMAFPHAVVPNDTALLGLVEQLIAEKEVAEVVIGHSKNLDGSDNPLQAAIEEFIGDMTLRVPVPIHLEPEQFTSAAAARTTGKNEMTDAAAAALILETYLQKQR